MRSYANILMNFIALISVAMIMRVLSNNSHILLLCLNQLRALHNADKYPAATLIIVPRRVIIEIKLQAARRWQHYNKLQ